MLNSRPRAAVIGASGIGKHHAKWYHLLGCELVAFAGSSPETVEKTSEALRDLFGFEGQGYWDVQEMLEEARPELVSVCSPPELHKEHVLAAAAAGCHVMCEKPVAWYEHDPERDALADAYEMLDAVEQAGVLAAVNTQYAAAAQSYFALCELAGLSAEVEPIERVEMQMDSRGRGGQARREEIWIDLASHPLSIVQAICGPGEMVAGSERCRIEEKQVEATFTYAARDKQALIEARVVVGNVPEGALVRKLGVNGVLADYEGRNDEAGQFCAYLSIGDTELKATDFVQESLLRFVKAVCEGGKPLMAFADGAANLRMQINILRAGGQSAGQ